MILWLKGEKYNWLYTQGEALTLSPMVHFDKKHPIMELFTYVHPRAKNDCAEEKKSGA